MIRLIYPSFPEPHQIYQERIRKPRVTSGDPIIAAHQEARVKIHAALSAELKAAVIAAVERLDWNRFAMFVQFVTEDQDANRYLDRPAFTAYACDILNEMRWEPKPGRWDQSHAPPEPAVVSADEPAAA